MKRRILFSLGILLSGCTHSIHQVQVSDFVPFTTQATGKIVKARGEQFVILGFVGQTDYIDKTLHRLIASCPQGTVTGVTTELSTSHGFFSWHNKVFMQGLCVGPVAKL